MTIEQLNAEYGIDGHLRIIEGNGGLPFIEVDNGKGSAAISAYAGQVLSYRPAGVADDVMFLSTKAYYQDGKAIKGGVPVCWPWFGSDPEDKGRPGHGFVRNRHWNVVATEATEAGDTKVTLGLSDTEETRSIWPNAFELAIEISVGSELTLELVTRNKSEHEFPITQGLHTYFSVGDIGQVKVLGLDETEYMDMVDGGAQKGQEGAISFSGEVNRIYLGSGDLAIEDAALGRKILIGSSNSNTTVVWNPWADVAASMGDLEDDDYKRFVCVETTNAADDVVEVAAGEEYRLTATYRVEKA